MNDGSGNSALAKLKSCGGALFFLFLGGMGLFVPLASLFRLFTTGELPVLIPWERQSWGNNVTTPFTLDYFVSLMAYTALATVGTGALNAAFAEAFGSALFKTSNPDRPAFFYVAPIIAIVVFVLPVLAPMTWL